MKLLYINNNFYWEQRYIFGILNKLLRRRKQTHYLNTFRSLRLNGDIPSDWKKIGFGEVGENSSNDSGVLAPNGVNGNDSPSAGLEAFAGCC